MMQQGNNNSGGQQGTGVSGEKIPQRSSDLKWPPELPKGPKPKLVAVGAADWRYQRYLKNQYQKGKTADQVLPKDKWIELHYNPAERGDRPGRMGGTQQVAAKEELRAEGIQIVENVEVGGRFPDGVSPKPNTQGGKDYYEVGTMLKKGIPQSRERVKIEDELKAFGKNDSVTFVDKNDPSKRITYKKGDSTDSKTLDPDS